MKQKTEIKIDDSRQPLERCARERIGGTAGNKYPICQAVSKLLERGWKWNNEMGIICN